MDEITRAMQPLMGHLPDDPVQAVLWIFGAAFIVLLIGCVTVVPAVSWLLGLPFRWTSAGLPGLPVDEYNGPDITWVS